VETPEGRAARGGDPGRREADRALWQSRERLAAIVELVPDGICILGRDGRIIFANAAAEHILGTPRHEMAGRAINDPAWKITTVEEQPFPDEDVPFAQVMRTGGPVHGVELAVERADKTRVILTVNGSPMRNAAGDITGVVLSFSNITTPKRAERALRESEERYRRLVAVCPDAIFINRSNKIVFVNEACLKLFGADRPEQLLGKSPFDFTHPDDHALVRARIRRQLENGEPVALVEERIYRLDGSLITVEVAAAPIIDQGVRSIQAVLRDITERKRAEQERARLEAQMQHAQRLESLGILAGGIAHDFNNLLVGILGNADLALQDLLPQAPARKRVEDIKAAGLRASDLTRQMLAYAGKGKIEVEVLDLNKLIAELAHLLQVAISKKVALKFNFCDRLPAIVGDAAQLQQVLMNLITNASDAIGDTHGTIALATGAVEAGQEYLASEFAAQGLPAGPYVCLEVSDTGCGMDEQTKARIFEPFFTTKFAGRGLGLSAVLGIVRSHSGAIKVHSEPGKGTTFRVLLPCCGKQAEAGRGPAEAQVAAPRGTGLVLVVDDEENMRRVVKMALERAGFKVLTAVDGPEGVKLFREHKDRVVLVILDMTMPRLSGAETCRELRQIRPDVRVLFTSGYNEQEAITGGGEQGLTGFLQKPFRMETLLRKVAEIRRSGTEHPI